MVIVTMRYDHSINVGYIFDLARDVCITLGAKPAERTTSLAEYRVEEDAETTWKFDEVAGVAEPCCAKGGGFSGGEEFGFSDCDGWRCCIGFIAGP